MNDLQAINKGAYSRLKGYFRGNKSLPHAFPTPGVAVTASGPEHSTLLWPGYRPRRPALSESSRGPGRSARPPGGGAGRQSRGPRCGRHFAGRGRKMPADWLRSPSASRDSGHAGDARARDSSLQAQRWAPRPGCASAAEARQWLGWAAASRDFNQPTRIWSDRPGATRSAKMPFRPARATAGELGGHSNKRKKQWAGTI